MINVCNAPKQVCCASGARSLTNQTKTVSLEVIFKRVCQSGCTTKMFLSTAIVIQTGRMKGGVATVSLKHRYPRAPPPQQSAGERQACARAPTNREAKRKPRKTPFNLNGAGYKSRRFLPTTSIPSPSWPTQRLSRTRGPREASPGRAR